jgi:hypothetical protein
MPLGGQKLAAVTTLIFHERPNGICIAAFSVLLSGLKCYDETDSQRTRSSASTNCRSSSVTALPPPCAKIASA